MVGEHPHPVAVGTEHPGPFVAADPSGYAPNAPVVASDLNAAFTAGHPTTSLAQQVADLSTHHIPSPVGDLAKADRVVLGKWAGMDDGYIGEARRNGGIYFDTGDDTWNALKLGLGSDEEKILGWQVNERFLRSQLENHVGRIEYVLPDEFQTVEELAKVRRRSYSAMEINFLKNNAAAYGYRQHGNVWMYEGVK